MYIFFGTCLKKGTHNNILIFFNFILGVVGSFWFRLGSWPFLHLLWASPSWESYSFVWGKCVLPTLTFLQQVQCGIRVLLFLSNFSSQVVSKLKYFNWVHQTWPLPLLAQSTNLVCEPLPMTSWAAWVAHKEVCPPVWWLQWRVKAEYYRCQGWFLDQHQGRRWCLS